MVPTVRKGWLLIAVLATALLLVAWGPPVVHGWHLGYNAATDSSCETLLGVQWCGGPSPATREAEVQTREAAERQPEVEEGRRHEAEARGRELREEAERPKREAEERRRTQREVLESEGKSP